ncbi:unnamed protein product [Allacma fusca]|uniref:Uncharacterized protein n=1 Tax=Allacma fusca TaxID=39272 RepID=A0A8J2PHY4_9HEXA|nr:unnamed protein product [Allacma fusca]
MHRTRGDCGDLGGSSKKRRRISEGGSNNAAATKVFVPQTSPSINTGNNVSVPFSQQSPDTTTQTPQTDMSPASSVSSEQSVFGGNRSTNSTPTPVPISTPATTGKTLPTSKGPSKGKDNTNFGFPWPQVPVSQSPTPTSASVLATSPNTSTMTFWPNPNQTNMAVNCIPIMTTSANSNRAGINPTGVTTLKKSGCQHHLTSKGVGISSKKRASSPCPNIDVRQIPLEQNRPPPRQILHIPTSATSHTITHDNPSVSLFPITSTTPVESPLLNMNTGFSISPVITSTNNSGSTLQPNILTNTLQFAPQPQPLQATTTLVNSNLNIFPLPLQFQRVPSPVVTSGTPSGITTTPANTFIHQSLPSSITISMVGGSPNSSQVQLPSSSSPAIMNNNANCNSGQPSQPTLSSSTSASTRDNNVSEKSPLQLVQDVVDRFQSSKTGADGKDDAVSVDVVVSTSSSSPKVAASVEPSKDGDNKPGEADSKLTESDKSVRLETTKDLAEKREGKPKKPGSDSNTKLQSENVSIHPCTVSTTPVVSSPSSIVEPEPPKITVVNLPLPVSSSIATSTAIPISATVSAAHNMNLTQPLVATSSIMSCATSTGVISVNAANSLGNHQPIILQQQPSQTDIQTSSFITTTAGHGNSVGGTQSIRYPLFQTIQPFFLNSTGAPGGQLIISPQPTATAHPADQQPFIYEQQTQGGSDHQMQSMLQQTTMVLDPSVCGNTPGAKKKKKRLSKKQQQQQAQLHLQQQLLLQQLAHQQAQVQQQVAQAQQHQTIPLTIFPQSFNLGPQGFSLQPMNMNMNMNFFPTPTILTLPNLILNPADGTLFLQPSPLQTTTTTTHPQTVKLGQFPIAAAPNTVVSAGQATLQAQQTQSINVIAPKKDGNFNNNITLTALPSDHMTLIKTGPASADIVSDDSRQNPTPDSSTNDCQLGLNLNPANSITISIPPMANNNAINISSLNQSNNKKLNVKARAVSSSSGNGAPKRIFTQKQILPKIDSTTPSVENS